MDEPERLIPLHGGCRKLKSFQVAQPAAWVEDKRRGRTRTSTDTHVRTLKKPAASVPLTERRWASVPSLPILIKTGVGLHGFLASFVQASFRVMVRLKINWPGVLSLSNTK